MSELEELEQAPPPKERRRPAIQLSNQRIDCARCGRTKQIGGLAISEGCAKGEVAMDWEFIGRQVCVPCFLEAYPPSAAKVQPPAKPRYFKPLKDGDPFPFGTHKGKPMGEVPAQFLDWLRGQDWLPNWPAVADYIERNKKAIDHELAEEGIT